MPGQLGLFVASSRRGNTGCQRIFRIEPSRIDEPGPVARPIPRAAKPAMGSLMKRLIADWLWRMALLGALCWIGWELHGFRADMMEPVDEQTTASSEPDVVHDSLDALHDDIEELKQKVDAILVAMARSR